MRQITLQLSIALLGAMTMGSCAGFRELSREPVQPLNRSDLHQFDGNYSNRPVSSFKNVDNELYPQHMDEATLWESLSRKNQQAKTEPISDQVISIRALSRRQARVQLMEGEKVIASMILKGHIRKGYLNYRHHFLFIPFMPIYFARKDFRYRLALGPNGELLMHKTWSTSGFAILAGYHSKGRMSLEFEKKEVGTD